MQLSRLLLFAASSACFGSAAGCESEEPNRVGTAEFAPGPGGAAGISGRGGTAGGGDGGAVLAGGGAGVAGQSGSGPAGAAGTAGVAGTGVLAGTSGFDGGGGEPRQCAEACSRDADCQSALSSQIYRCNRTAQRCETFAEPCHDDAECIPGASQWFWSCSSDQDCFFFDDDVCVTVAGVGRCARAAPQPAVPGGGCAFPVPEALSLPRLGAAGMALVCGDSSQRCGEGRCFVPCTSDTQCTPDKNGSICNRETGLCECIADDDCRGSGVSRCNTATHRCECASERDCENLPNADACLGGRCGCSSAAACKAERIFSGTRYACE